MDAPEEGGEDVPGVQIALVGQTEGGGEMTSLLMILLAMVLLSGCAGWRSETTCSGIEERWGKPAKIIKNDDGTLTYHWFFEESHHGAAPFTSHTSWVGYEFVCDQNGKIISKKNFYPQPNFLEKER